MGLEQNLSQPSEAQARATLVNFREYEESGKVDYPKPFIMILTTLYKNRAFLENPEEIFKSAKKIGRNEQVWDAMRDELLTIDGCQLPIDDKSSEIEPYLGIARILGMKEAGPNAEAALADLEARYGLESKPFNMPSAEVVDSSQSETQAGSKTAAVSEQETPEQKAERLLRNVTKAEFDSFQEYSFTAVRSGNGFISVRNKNEIRRDDGGVYEGSGDYELNREDDIVPYVKDFLDRRMHARSCWVPLSAARLIDPNFVTERGGELDTKWGELYCIVGKKAGKVVIQGGGKLHSDFAHRPNFSSFKLVFDSDDAANEYINWLVSDPKDAYGPVLKRATGSYDEQGNFRQVLIPPRGEVYDGREKFYDPFSNIPNSVIIKDWRYKPEPKLYKSEAIATSSDEVAVQAVSEQAIPVSGATAQAENVARQASPTARTPDEVLTATEVKAKEAEQERIGKLLNKDPFECTFGELQERSRLFPQLTAALERSIEESRIFFSDVRLPAVGLAGRIKVWGKLPDSIKPKITAEIDQLVQKGKQGDQTAQAILREIEIFMGEQNDSQGLTNFSNILSSLPSKGKSETSPVRGTPTGESWEETIARLRAEKETRQQPQVSNTTTVSEKLSGGDLLKRERAITDLMAQGKTREEAIRQLDPTAITTPAPVSSAPPVPAAADSVAQRMAVPEPPRPEIITLGEGDLLEQVIKALDARKNSKEVILEVTPGVITRYLKTLRIPVKKVLGKTIYATMQDSSTAEIIGNQLVINGEISAGKGEGRFGGGAVFIVKLENNPSGAGVRPIDFDPDNPKHLLLTGQAQGQKEKIAEAIPYLNGIIIEQLNRQFEERGLISWQLKDFRIGKNTLEFDARRKT